MKLKLKVVAIIIFSVAFAAISTVLVINGIVSVYIGRQEKEVVNQNFKVTSMVLAKEESELKTKAADWSQWMETYNFIKNRNPEYIKEYLQNISLTNLELNFIIYMDKSGNVVYSKELDLKTGIDKPLDESFVRQLNKNNSLNTLKSVDDTHSGLLFLSGKLILAAVSPVTSPDKKLQPDGSLIFGRYIESAFMYYLNNVTSSSNYFKELNISNLFKNSGAVNFISLSNTVKFSKTAETMTGYNVIKDIYGESSIVQSFSMPRTGYIQAMHYIKLSSAIFLVLMSLVIFFIIKMLDKFIISRMKHLNSFMNTVAESKDTAIQVQFTGKDEISELAQSTNKMLSELDSAHNRIRNMKERFTLIMDATQDGYFDVNLESEELFISKDWQKLIGIEARSRNKLLQNFLNNIHPDYRENIKNDFYFFIENNGDYFNKEYKLIVTSGESIWVSHRGKIVDRDKYGKPLRFVSILSDITQRKQNEEEILFLSHSDPLTSLNNRHYMENKFKELDIKKSVNYAIIICDLNGLKLVNDVLGYAEGDKILCVITNILRNNCSDGDIIARWGGGQFVILTLNKEKGYINNLMRKIKDECEFIHQFLVKSGYNVINNFEESYENSSSIKVKISIALGSAESKGSNLKTEALMKLAEERMYRNKLLESRSVRNAIITSLKSSLFEKDSETEEHTLRLRKISKKVAISLGLPHEMMDELELLGLLHDIGKIGIPEQILNKPGKLTPDEWEIMKSHTEIGYRIAASIPELVYIADAILSHHERFDGTGYPRGLKGKEIPLLSRIITIVDSYDVMTHSRPYKKAYSTEVAVEELKKCSGTQFDPELVDLVIRILGSKSPGVHQNAAKAKLAVEY